MEVYGYLKKTKNVHSTIFTDASNTATYPGFDVVRVNSIDYNTIWSKLLFVLGIPRYYYSDLIAKLKDYDIIETSNPEFYIFAYQSYLAAKKYNTKLILRTSQTLEGFFLFRLSKYIVVPFARKAYDYASRLLFTNPDAAHRAEKLGLIERNSKKTVIIGHATDTSMFKPFKVKKYKKKIILSVGGLYKIKGHHLIIKSLSRVRKRYDAELWIVGEGYYKNHLEILSEKLKVSGYVKFLGGKSKEELAKIYNVADVFVLANYQEITPAVNEALACGTPVVVMECGGRKFVIPNEDYGLVSKKFDVSNMSNKIIKILENKNLAKKISNNGRLHILKNFSVENVAEKFYDSFIGQ